MPEDVHSNNFRGDFPDKVSGIIEIFDATSGSTKKPAVHHTKTYCTIRLKFPTTTHADINSKEAKTSPLTWARTSSLATTGTSDIQEFE